VWLTRQIGGSLGMAALHTVAASPSHALAASGSQMAQTAGYTRAFAGVRPPARTRCASRDLGAADQSPARGRAIRCRADETRGPALNE